MRKTFLIKPKVQLTHLAWILGVVGISTIISYTMFEAFVLQSLTDTAVQAGKWIEIRNSLRIGFAITLSILLVAIGIENYFFFHRFVGPLYALEKGLKRLAKGDFSGQVQIRKSDQLADVIKEFEEVKKQLQVKMEAHEKTAALLMQELDRVLTHATKENIGSLQSKLKEIREQVVKKAA